jgi:hypothetical protein
MGFRGGWYYLNFRIPQIKSDQLAWTTSGEGIRIQVNRTTRTECFWESMVTSDHSQTIITWAAAVSAIASIVNAICVVVLARITSTYAKSTAEILEESQKTRVAAQKQVSGPGIFDPLQELVSGKI